MLKPTGARLCHDNKHTWEGAACDLDCALPDQHQLVWGDTFPRQDLPCWHKLHLNQLQQRMHSSVTGQRSEAKVVVLSTPAQHGEC
jgi:hypothetical protein